MTPITEGTAHDSGIDHDGNSGSGVPVATVGSGSGAALSMGSLPVHPVNSASTTVEPRMNVRIFME
jgi:hypothetical protein